MQRYNFFANNMGEYPFFCVLEHEITKTKKKIRNIFGVCGFFANFGDKSIRLSR